METWLTNNEIDKIWIDVTDLNKDKLSMYTHNRSKSHGGGLALVCKSHYKVKMVKKGATPSFEYAIWELTVKNRHIYVITGIYHPQYSTKN